MNSFYSAKWGNIFLLYMNNWTTNKISKFFITVVHVVIQNLGSNGDIRQKLEMLHSKLQNFSEKDKIVKSTYSIKQI